MEVIKMGTYNFALNSFEDTFLNSKVSEFAAIGRMKLSAGRTGAIKLILQDRMKEEIPDFP